uniref:Phospho-2-dehydro-3-deoxyheptonate aldolase n=1 Tax=Candidatus Aschnera chinzeii TaxID=1485666 RepID=A0AAT9G557_9ENTR|nr:MAG: 3-deoxy-7-phosphoheptulonate synthase AroH [Candidatus Aschnera chinzeii]
MDYRCMNGKNEFQGNILDTLITPKNIFKEFPISNEMNQHIAVSREKIKFILIGKDKRLLVIIGPCSIHDINAALEYAHMLVKLRIYYKDYLEIVMRTYFEKPRTIIGWKGLILDPDLNNSYNVNKGIKLARKLLININALGLPTATEFLDIILSQYIIDLISWGSIGARTCESQIHRQMASSFACGIGFKNSTNGDINSAINAICAARNKHVILIPNINGKIVSYQTVGNPYCNVILRGGKKHSNYHAQNIAITSYTLDRLGLNKQIIIDFSHDNCHKKYKFQLEIAKDIARQLKNGSITISGVMVESFLLEGSQKIINGKCINYGQSITDPCLGWHDTKTILNILAEGVKYRLNP